MNALYRRYRTDERFRAAVLASAHRQRAQVMACLFAAATDWLFSHRRDHAPCTHLAGQG